MLRRTLGTEKYMTFAWCKEHCTRECTISVRSYMPCFHTYSRNNIKALHVQLLPVYSWRARISASCNPASFTFGSAIKSFIFLMTLPCLCSRVNLSPSFSSLKARHSLQTSRSCKIDWPWLNIVLCNMAHIACKGAQIFEQTTRASSLV
jgi:hypothetical protein